MYTVSLRFDGKDNNEKEIVVHSNVKPELKWALKVNHKNIIYILRIDDVVLDTTANTDYIICKCNVLKKIYDGGEKNE
jgi:hypothetical protein